METIIIYAALIIVGLCMGSFAGATTWRIRAKWVRDYSPEQQGYNKAEIDRLKKLSNNSIFKDRSRCLDCGYKLCWYDLIPLFSWAILRGKCRKCHKPIGYLEPIIEVAMAIFFVLSYVFLPFSMCDFFGIARFVIWLVAGVALATAFVFDYKWFFLPDKSTYIVIGLGIVNSIITILLADDKFLSFSSIMGSVLILSGIYYLIYNISNGKWIGFGDIKLGLGLALMLANWKLAFVALFAANLIGCIVVTPNLIKKKMTAKTHVAFGPLLIVGYAISGLFGNLLINLYISLL